LLGPAGEDYLRQAGQFLAHFYHEWEPILYKNIAEEPRGTHITSTWGPGGMLPGERMFGLRQASRYRTDPEGAIRAKQGAIEQRQKGKERHEKKDQARRARGQFEAPP
jgi:hypothetical protein